MAVKAALTKQGTPYVWGAKGPKVFDCSGLTQWAWGQAGVTIGPDTYTQVKQGVPVAPGDVQAGDLIFPQVFVGFTGTGPRPAGDLTDRGGARAADRRCGADCAHAKGFHRPPARRSVTFGRC